MNIIQEIKGRYISGNIIEKLIFINIGVFVFALLLTVFSKLYNGEGSFIADWFALSDNFNSMLFKPWSIISYGFLHAGFLHILFNCIGLYFIGNLFLQYFSEKQLLSFYLLGTFFGGVLYLLSQNYFPLFQGRSSSLVGASAGVSAIFVGVATYIPNYELKIRFIGYVKLWYLAAIWVGLDVLGLIGTNAGGNFAHIGGALFGFLYVKRASNKEITVFDSIGSLFKKKEKPLQTVYKSTEKKAQRQPNLEQQEINEILDKISKSGYDTLTKSEKEFLFKQGKK
ncbi:MULTISPECIES: rhomboid family protein [unclassified Polaribacter]|uniref:rhomboid family protein n=1 Tax=unclassified Polaribacter TaxID=196858 RepID=UPI0011BEA0FB|nr:MULTISPECIES: rhomboid family intramembrane serine protease [unclassified Polaribacter]TXD52532.1 rhomboid family intramembrane serine protease [Polaribacter sp. IC063]TXD60518.1 rhomboid family intramembrane serine protease [Polaribacter sp. IC066]